MRTDTHHLFFPKPWYQSGTAKRFRELPCLTVRIDIDAHRLIHARQKPPRKPKREEMERFIKRHEQKECSCYT